MFLTFSVYQEEDFLFTSFKGPEMDLRSKGHVLSYKDGVVVSDGLLNAASGELVHILTKTKAITAAKDETGELQYEVYTTTGIIFEFK